jgi:SAM-dependent methyltransferase
MPGGPEERLQDDRTSPWWGEHLSRYEWAARRVAGKVVLDAACGTGFGIRVLAAARAAWVVGVDIDAPVVRGALQNGNGEHANCLVASIPRLPFRPRTFDVVTSFETLEHVQDGRGCLLEFRRVLKDDGVLLCSTPNRSISSPDGVIRNPFHVREFTADEFRAALSDVFGHVDVLGQTCRRAPTAATTSRIAWATLTMRGVRKLPWRLRDTASRALTGSPLFPDPAEFAFDANPDLSPTLVAVCAPNAQ